MSRISIERVQPKAFTVLILLLMFGIRGFSFQEGIRGEPASSIGAKALLGDWGVETRGSARP